MVLPPPLRALLCQVHTFRSGGVGWFPLNKQQITVRVPATTSNLGPGFDCLGVALQIYNYVTVTHSEGETVPMARSAARKYFKRIGVVPFPFSCTVAGNVPAARGLGSGVLAVGDDRALGVLDRFRRRGPDVVGQAGPVSDFGPGLCVPGRVT